MTTFADRVALLYLAQVRYPLAGGTDKIADIARLSSEIVCLNE